MTSKPGEPRPQTASHIVELPEAVKNQIAAGEVVERPASVVKELVENALDAGAHEIRIDLEEGGVKLVRVIDDGCGMGPEDLLMAFCPHATSKLREVADLDHIASLGFRGEALASIGSVSRASIVSRTTDEAMGHRIENRGGEIGPVLEAGGARGTTIEIRDLFYNTPARRRFLKRTQTELARVLDVVQRLALAQLEAGFVVTHDGKRVYDVERTMDLAGRVRRTFGADLADSLVAVSGVDGTVRVEGLLAPPRFARRDTSRQMWFLNGRPLRDKVLVRVLKQAFHGFQVEARHPVAFLSLSMDPALVDVNVHPTKSEVRFREDRRLFSFLVAVLRRALSEADLATPGEDLLRTAWRRSEREAPQGYLPNPGALEPLRGGTVDPGSFRAREGTAAASERDLLVPAAGPRAPGVGETSGTFDVAGALGAAGEWGAQDAFEGPYLQIANTYLLRRLPDGFEIIDQHALHERLTFEGLKRQVEEGQVEVQRRLIPDLVELSRAEVKAVEAQLEALSASGIELSVFSPTTIAVQGLPALLRRPDPEAIVRDAVAALERTGKAPRPFELVEEVLHSAACRSSVMAGDPLTQDEIRALLSRASVLESDQTCPHGRPTRVRFRLADLEKAFHRR